MKLPSWIWSVSRKWAVRIWLACAIAFLLLVALELAGVEGIPGFRTVSDVARHNRVVAILVALLFPGGLIWWLLHAELIRFPRRSTETPGELRFQVTVSAKLLEENPEFAAAMAAEKIRHLVLTRD